MEWVMGVIGLVLLIIVGIKIEKILGRILVELSEIRDLLAAIYDKNRL